MPYDHTQRGRLHWLTGAMALLFAALAFPAGADEPGAGVALGVAAALVGLVTPCFAHLRVRDAGDGLRVEFGPWAVFVTSVRYADVVSAEPGRTALVDGWGIHWVPGRGWTWNIDGRGAVELRLRDGRRMRIGTDEPEVLATHVRSRIAG